MKSIGICLLLCTIQVYLVVGGTNDPGLPDSPDRSDLTGGPLGWGGIKLSVRGRGGH